MVDHQFFYLKLFVKTISIVGKFLLNIESSGKVKSIFILYIYIYIYKITIKIILNIIKF